MQAAKGPERSMDLVVRVRRIFDEDDFSTDCVSFDAERAQVSYARTPAPNLRPETPISDASLSTQVSPLGVQDRVPSGEERKRLVSRKTTLALNSAFNALAQTILVDNVRTLEDLVGQMLPPILRSWLDNNLPTIIEHLVRVEIERVSRPRNGSARLNQARDSLDKSNAA